MQNKKFKVVINNNTPQSTHLVKYKLPYFFGSFFTDLVCDRPNWPSQHREYLESFDYLISHKKSF